MKTKQLIYTALLLIFSVNLISAQEIEITTNSKEALKLFIEGRNNVESFEGAKASNLFEKAIEIDSNFAMAYLYRSWTGGGATVRKQNLDKAVSLSDKISEGEKLVILYFKARADGEGKKRKEYLDKLLELFPKDKRVNNLAGVYYYSVLKDFKKAIKYYTIAVNIDKKFAAAQNMLGYSNMALKKYDKAEKAFQAYIQLIPDKAAGYDSYAELLLTQGKYDESIVQYKKALEKDPTFFYSILGVGHNYIFKDDYVNARKNYQQYYDKATNINMKFSALYWKAVSYVHEGKLIDAINTLEERKLLAEKENSINVTIFSTASQGLIMTELGDTKKGLNYYEKAVELNEKSDLPEKNKENIRVLGQLWLFYAYRADNELKKAKVVYDKIKPKVEKRSKPHELDLLNNILGFGELKDGNYDKSIEYFLKADREADWSIYYTAMAYKKKGNKKKANELFEKLMQINKNGLSLALVRKRVIDELKK